MWGLQDRTSSAQPRTLFFLEQVWRCQIACVAVHIAFLTTSLCAACLTFQYCHHHSCLKEYTSRCCGGSGRNQRLQPLHRWLGGPLLLVLDMVVQELWWQRLGDQLHQIQQQLHAPGRATNTGRSQNLQQEAYESIFDSCYEWGHNLHRCKDLFCNSGRLVLVMFWPECLHVTIGDFQFVSWTLLCCQTCCIANRSCRICDLQERWLSAHMHKSFHLRSKRPRPNVKQCLGHTQKHWQSVLCHPAPHPGATRAWAFVLLMKVGGQTKPWTLRRSSRCRNLHPLQADWFAHERCPSLLQTKGTGGKYTSASSLNHQAHEWP